MGEADEVARFFEVLPSLGQERQLIEALARVLQQVGFVAFSYGSGRVTEQRGLTAMRIWSTLDPQWIAHYVENGYYREDRLVRAALIRVDPFRFEEIFATPPRSARQREMESRFGYGSGVIVPIHGRSGLFGILSAAAPNQNPPQPITWEQLGEVQLIATVFHQRVVSLNLPISSVFLEAPPVMLSPRERDCLAWAAAGKINRDIGELLGISQRTVKKHVENAMHKLDATTRGQTIARAIALKLIET